MIACKVPFPPFAKARENGEWPNEYNNKVQYLTCTEYGEARGINHAAMRGIDGTSVRDLTRAEIFLRKHVLESIKVLKKYMPGFEKSSLRNYAMGVGIRETRRIIGEYTLNFHDIIDKGTFPDSIGIFPVWMDALDVYPKAILPINGDCFQMPYRCLIPKQIENLLVGGRSISCDRDTVGTVRQINCCAITGQAAGIAAALSARDGIKPRELDIDILQSAIRAQGVRLS